LEYQALGARSKKKETSGKQEIGNKKQETEGENKE
jgi:hypothetical protein